MSMEATSVAFDGRAVRVLSNIPEVHSHVREQFEFMLDENAPEVSSLKLYREENEYVLEGPAFNPIRQSIIEPLLFLVKDEVRLEFMRSRQDLLWLHAGAAEKNGKARIILGVSGQGKSTLTISLCENGWTFLSDDIVPISMDKDIAYPFPQMPSRRVPSSSDWDANELGSAARKRARFERAQLCSGPISIGDLIFPHFQRGVSTSLNRVSKGEAAIEMLRNATNFCDHKVDAVARCARMAKVLSAYHLSYSDGKEACNLLVKLQNG